MASIAASRARLQQRKNAVNKAEEAIEKADEVYSALYTRQEERRRREYSDCDSEDRDEDEDEDGEPKGDGDENENVEDKGSDYADEEEEGFDFDAKSERLADEVMRCKVEAQKAQRAFLNDFEHCVKADISGPLTALHTAMCAKLPIEVRNMIYFYLIAEKRPPTYFGQDSYNPNFQSGTEIKVDHALQDGRTAFDAGTYDILQPGGWLLNPEYVGHGTAREIAEMFYILNKFVVPEVRFLPELLIVDRTQTGLMPYEYIRGKLGVGITTTRCNGGNERAWQSTENEVEFLDGVCNQLNTLNLLKHKSQLSITITVRTSAPLWKPESEGERRFYNVMEAIRWPIYELIHGGVQVSVNHTAQSSLRTRTISEGPTNYFAMGREEWEEEKRSHGPGWLPSANFISREDIEEDRNEDRLRELLKQRWGHLRSIDAYGI